MRFQGCAISSTCFDFICMPLGLGVVYQAAAASSPATLRAARQTSSVYKSCQETPGSKMFKDFKDVFDRTSQLRRCLKDSLVFYRPAFCSAPIHRYGPIQSPRCQCLFFHDLRLSELEVFFGGFPGFPAQNGNEGWPCLPFVMTEHHT